MESLSRTNPATAVGGAHDRYSVYGVRVDQTTHVASTTASAEGKCKSS